LLNENPADRRKGAHAPLDLPESIAIRLFTPVPVPDFPFPQNKMAANINMCASSKLRKIISRPLPISILNPTWMTVSSKNKRVTESMVS
jgi:hypothetical protein